MKPMLVFQSPYDQYKARNGQYCEVVRPKDPSTYDSEECGPMYIIRFADGAEIEAWPEEIGKC